MAKIKKLTDIELRKYYLDHFMPFQKEWEKFVGSGAENPFAIEDKWKIRTWYNYKIKMVDYGSTDKFYSAREWGAPLEITYFALKGYVLDDEVIVAIKKEKDLNSIISDIKLILKRHKKSVESMNSKTRDKEYNHVYLAPIFSDYYTERDVLLRDIIDRHIKKRGGYSRANFENFILKKIRAVEILIDPDFTVLDREKRIVKRHKVDLIQVETDKRKKQLEIPFGKR